MKILGKTGYLAALTLAALTFGSNGWGQSIFLKYGPVAGIQKSTGGTYQNTAAASSDVIGLWGATPAPCTASSFLRGDGNCAVPAGTGVSSVTVPAPLTATTCSGSAACAITWTGAQTANNFLATPNGSTGPVGLRPIAVADVPPVVLGSTANGGVSGTLLVANGGTGVATLPVHGVLLGEGTSGVGNVAAMPVDTFLQGQGAGADPAGLAVGNCAGTNQALTYSTSLHSFLCSTVVGFSTPTSLVSLTAHTGSSINSMAADSSPALDQTIAPTWTAQHIFTKNFTTGGLAGDAPIFLKSAQPGTIMDATGQATDAKLWNNVVAGLDWLLQGVNDAGTVSRNAIDITRVAASPGIATIALGNVTDKPTITGNGVNITPQSGSFTVTGTGFTTSPSGTATYLIIGKTAFLFMPAISATSNATTFTITGLPSNLQPAAIGFQEGIVSLTDNGAEAFGQATFAAGSGTIAMEKNGSTTGFTASGSKGFGLQIITYSLN